MKTFDFVVDDKYAGTRLDLFLQKEMDFSRSRIKKLVEDNKVLLNGKASKKAGVILKTGMSINVQIDDLKPMQASAEDLPLDIVYEDNCLAVINKAQGMCVHPAVGNREGTLANALLFHIKDLSGINGVIRPGIVHRLDKDTSGLIVIAKTNEAHLSLAKQIAEKTCHRHYIALLDGCPNKISGRIESNIARSTKDFRKMEVVEPPKGKHAITDYSVLKHFGRYSLVAFELHTGRTHQIRVHCSVLGCSIVGDKVYGKPSPFKVKGQLLHADKINFLHPITNDVMEFTAPLPQHFTNVLTQLEN